MITAGTIVSQFKLAVFDMDGTLLKGRTIFVFAEKFGFTDRLQEILRSDFEPYEKTIAIASLLKGFQKPQLLHVFRGIPLQDHVSMVIDEFKKREIPVAIVTDSYNFVAEDLKQRLGCNFAFANSLIIDNDIITGEIVLHNKNLREECIDHRIYSISKSHVMEELCKRLCIPIAQVLAVGDGVVDMCMLKKAGCGVAFNASQMVQRYADFIINDMQEILQLL